MSSGNLPRTQHPELFRWSPALDPAAYIHARYTVTSVHDGEATALAMHLVNAGFATGDLSYTYTMTGVIQQLLDIIDHSYGITLDRSSVNVGRFITHLRYLFVRIHQHQQLTDEPAPVMKVIRESYPAALRCARTIASLLELRLDTDISDDETAYLAMHVARVTGHAS